MNYRQANDYELIYMVRENDEGSQDILYEKYYPIVKNIANEFYQKYKNYGYDYDDFVQEGLIAFQKSIINYNENRNTLFYTFTTLCVRRALLTFSRNIARPKKCLVASNYVSVDEYERVLSDIKSDIDLISNEQDLEKVTKKFLFNLSFDVGCIFELRLNGFSYREISNILEIPISTVEFRNRSGKKSFARMLKDYYEKTV